jgi:hypothetical protein
VPPKTKKQAKFMQAVANNPEFANKVGVNQSVGQEFTKEKSMNNRTKHIMNEKDEIRRVDKEIRKNEGYKAGGMMKDKEGRAMAMNKKGMTDSQMNDAAGRAMMKKGGATKKAKGKKMQGYNARLDDSLGARKGKKKQSMKARRDESKGMKKSAGKKAYSGNRKSAQGSASKRADGIARKGRTKGRMV